MALFVKTSAKAKHVSKAPESCDAMSFNWFKLRCCRGLSKVWPSPKISLIGHVHRDFSTKLPQKYLLEPLGQENPGGSDRSTDLHGWRYAFIVNMRFPGHFVVLSLKIFEILWTSLTWIPRMNKGWLLGLQIGQFYFQKHDGVRGAKECHCAVLQRSYPLRRGQRIWEVPETGKAVTMADRW